MSKQRTRVENGYRKTNSKDGRLHIDLYPEIASHVDEYCCTHNLNRKRFVNNIVKTFFNYKGTIMYLDDDEMSVAFSRCCERNGDDPSEILLNAINSYLDGDKEYQFSLKLKKLLKETPKEELEERAYAEEMKRYRSMQNRFGEVK